MRVLVCGGRDYADRAKVAEVLSAINPDVLIHGGATGADALAKEWMAARIQQDRSLWMVGVLPDWKAYGNAAGPIRNKEMLTWKPDLVVAFPGGRGTADMVRQAKKAGVRVREVEV